MELVLFIKKENYEKVREKLLKDPETSLASIIFRDAKALSEREGYYCYFSGLEKYCKKALKILKGLAEKVSEEEKNEVIRKIKEEQETAIQGLGNIF